MQVIEKVKVVPEGYNGAGMDGYNRRDVNGKANAGLTLGIIDSLGATNPAIKLVKPLAKCAIVNNMDGIDKWLRKIADADGNIDIDGIVTEEIEIINSIDNYDFTIPLIGDGNISRGNVTLSIPFINKGIVFNQSDLETFRQLLIQE